MSICSYLVLEYTWLTSMGMFGDKEGDS